MSISFRRPSGYYQLVKTLIYMADGQPVAAMVRGDRDLNEVKLKNALKAIDLTMATAEQVTEFTKAAVGFAGPVGLKEKLRFLADLSTAGLSGFVCGANAADSHLVNVDWRRDASDLAEFRDLALVVAGDPCPTCGKGLEISRGIEVGHIFKLGSKYSESMRCLFTDESGAELPMTWAATASASAAPWPPRSSRTTTPGIVWPRPLAPFDVLVVSLTPHDPASAAAAEALAVELEGAGLDVLLDDRDEP